MIKFFKKLDKTLTSLAVSSKALVEHIENIDLAKERSLIVIAGDILRTLKGISENIEKIAGAQKALEEYFSYELERFKEMDALQNEPKAKHDDEF